MKNNHFYIILILIFCFEQSKAQDDPIIRYGIKVGMNVSNTSTGFGSGPSFRDPKSKIGAAAGFIVNIPLSYRLTLQPEITYANEGSKQQGIPPNASSSTYTDMYLMKLNFVNIPVMLQYNDEESGLYLEAGPQLNWIVSSKLETKVTSENTPAEKNIKGYFNSRTLSVGIGAGINLINNLGFGARYTMGVIPVTEDIGTMKTNSFYLGVHYKL
jgi:hypothetical protein